MPNVFIKNILKEIKNSLGRFFSILSIVAIGVAFFAGIKASVPDMKNSADTHFDTYNVQDIQIYSTLGLYDNDIKMIKEIKGVKDVQGTFSMDTITHRNTSELVIKVFTYNDKQKENKIRLISGRMPQNEKECLVQASSTTGKLFGSFKEGDTIKLQSGTEEKLSESLKNDTFTIVGTCYNPNYVSYELGSSNIGSGSVNSFIYIQDTNVKKDYFTEIDVTVENAKEIDTYSDQYFDVVEPVLKRIESLEGRSIQAQRDKYQVDLDKAKSEYREGIAKGEKELAKAKKQIEDSEKTIRENEKKLDEAKIQLELGWAQIKPYMEQLSHLEELENAVIQIEEGEKQLPALKEQLTDLKNQLDSIHKELENQGVTDINATLLQLQQGKNAFESLYKAQADVEEYKIKYEEATSTKDKARYALIIVGLQAKIQILESQLKDLDYNTILQQIDQLNQAKSAISQLEDGISQLEDGISQINEGIKQKDTLIEQRNQLRELKKGYDKMVAAQAQYDAGVAQLNAGKKQLEQGKADYEKGLKTFEKEKNNNWKKIEDAQKEIDAITGEWIVLDRNSHYSYRDYGACADRMDRIATVFPIFFFLVAALVCMTTMTRMVDEQRTEIGTLKALGYSKAQIASKYLIYAALAGSAGSILGCALGMYIFPTVIFSAWNILYNFDGIVFKFQPLLILISSLSMIGVTLLATFFSIQKELIEVPSALMRPKAGKAGKKIILEKIKPLWSRMSFLHKVTARNIFRYKKRFFMTVIGIAGCSALICSGLGINDSIANIVPRQYGAVYHYNALISADNKKNVEETISKIDGIEEVYQEKQMSVTVDIKDKEQSATVHIIKETKNFSDFVSLLSVEDGSELSLDDHSIIVSQKMASDMKKNVGDTISFKDADGREIEAKIGGIVEHYVGHMIYVKESLFTTWDSLAKQSTALLIRTISTDSEFEAALGNKVMEVDGVKGITFYSTLKQNFNDTISSISFVAILLVVSAALLAFVVLYNLNNINISERIREIATLKVLGFTNKETNQYVNRESLILTFIGAIVGLGVGIVLHSLIMALAEMDDVMFGRIIESKSFLISVCLTMLFSVIINFIMARKIKKIQMVESLKAVE
ncbi:MAG: FtsX-like permease family protein [Bacillota bacterium]|nr:FtsX-like permease family protein [Bacillota bacterium]